MNVIRPKGTLELDPGVRRFASSIGRSGKTWTSIDEN